jgi:hypothetical protein
MSQAVVHFNNANVTNGTNTAVTFTGDGGTTVQINSTDTRTVNMRAISALYRGLTCRPQSSNTVSGNAQIDDLGNNSFTVGGATFR